MTRGNKPVRERKRRGDPDNLHQLSRSPSHGFGCRDQPFRPTGVLGVKFLGCCCPLAWKRRNVFYDCLLRTRQEQKKSGEKDPWWEFKRQGSKQALIELKFTIATTMGFSRRRKGPCLKCHNQTKKCDEIWERERERGETTDSSS